MSKEVCCDDGSVVGFLENCPTEKTLENIIEEIEEEDKVLVAENTDSFAVPLELQEQIDIENVDKPGSRLAKGNDRVIDILESNNNNEKAVCAIKTMDKKLIN